MAPSWGTSCLRSRRRIRSTESTKGLRPPWTQRTAPPPVEREPELEPEADVPAGPVLAGVLLLLLLNCLGDALGDISIGSE